MSGHERASYESYEQNNSGTSFSILRSSILDGHPAMRERADEKKERLKERERERENTTGEREREKDNLMPA